MTYDIGDGSLSFFEVSEIRTGVNLTNIRTVFKEDSVKELAESIFEDGLINPLVVMLTEHPDDGEEVVELVCGHRRLRAIQYIIANLDSSWGSGEVKCTQFDGGMVEAELLNGVENIEREEVDDVDTSAWIHRMVEDSGHTQANLAKKLHKSPTWISNRFTFAHKACDELKDAVREGIINFTAAYQLASKLSHDEQKKRIKKARSHNEKITLEEAERANDQDRTKRPSKKERERLLALAEKRAAEDPAKYHNAHGVAMALRMVDGLLTGSELEEVIDWDEPVTPRQAKAVEPEEGEE